MADGLPNFDPTAKIGKFPVWVWAVVLAGGVLLFTWLSRNKGDSNGDSGLTEVDGDLPEVSGGGLTGSNGGVSDDSVNDLNGMLNDWFGALNDTLAQNVDLSGATIPSGVAATPKGSKKSGPTWAQRAINYLTSQGYGGVAAQRSVQKYLEGKPLTQKQKERVNAAITGIGVKKNAPAVKIAKPKKTVKIKRNPPKKSPPKKKPPKKKAKNKSSLKR